MYSLSRGAYSVLKALKVLLASISHGVVYIRSARKLNIQLRCCSLEGSCIRGNVAAPDADRHVSQHVQPDDGLMTVLRRSALEDFALLM